MREVNVFKWEQQVIDGCRKSVKVLDKVALFHQFGQEADGEGQSNLVAIIECADGEVETVFAPMIQFTDGPKHFDGKAACNESIPLRDGFAGRALAALISVPDKEDYKRGAQGVPLLTKYAYEYADAMLAERTK